MSKWTVERTGLFDRKWIQVMVLLALVALTGCRQALAEQQPTASPTVADTPTLAPTATQTPLPTATPAPTSTPQPTATPVPPTATLVPPLAVTADGVNIWCAPLAYEGTKAGGPDEPDYARKMTWNGDQLQASIPAAYCVLAASFNQPVPEGLVLEVAEGKNVFLKLPLAAGGTQKEIAWTSISHSYVVNPPLWWADYRLAVASAEGKEIWSNVVRFAKPLPETCLFGGLPDPVTLSCPITDPWEIEPHPDATYPWDRSRLTPDP